MKTDSCDQDVGILIIDDHTISRYFTFEALRQFSKDIRQVRTGHEAIVSTRNWFPGIIFTDIHLPDISGLRMLQEIKSTWPQDQIHPQVVIITGDRSSRLKQKAKQANVAGFLMKPVQMENIRDCARRLIDPNSTVKESSAPNPISHMDRELRDLFSRELATQLPILDGYISQLNWKPASEILHQLIASSAMCREKQLERCSRLLYQAISNAPEPKTIAHAYHAFLRTASQTKTQL